MKWSELSYDDNDFYIPYSENQRVVRGYFLRTLGIDLENIPEDLFKPCLLYNPNGKKFSEYKSQKVFVWEVLGSSYADYAGDSWLMAFLKIKRAPAYIQNGELHLTLAGVDKKKGAAQLNSLSDFRLGKIFLPDCGRRTVRYNDWQNARYITVDGCRFLTGAGVHMENGTYELGVTDEFIENLPFSIDYLNEL